jgi:FkbH-like protein
MFESEVYFSNKIEPPMGFNIERFKTIHHEIEARSMLFWGEHCSECAIPKCYSTCALYVPRIDGKCQRFAFGVQRVAQTNWPERLEVLRVKFKKWAVFSSESKVLLYHPLEILPVEKRDRLTAKAISLSKNTVGFQEMIRARSHQKKKGRLNPLKTIDLNPDYFFLEVFNPTESSCLFNIEIRNISEHQLPFFSKDFTLKVGYDRIFIELEQIIPFVDFSEKVSVQICNRLEEEPLDLLFGLKEFITLKKDQEKIVKCLIWDLDNTLWNGILVEDGLKNLTLNSAAVELLRCATQTGLINVVVSKNNHSEAFRAIKAFGLDQYFVDYKISWAPKSSAITELIVELKIGEDSCIFIDDSAFERQEVAYNIPELRVYDVIDIDILTKKISSFGNGKTTSLNRTKLYKEEVIRKNTAIDLKISYHDFLRQCKTKIKITNLSPANIDRVFELSQRTNQLNFMLNRYSFDELQNLQANETKLVLVFDVSDRFGDLGIVGFCVLDLTRFFLQDLVFSCRVQGRRIEQFIITYLRDTHKPKKDLIIQIKKTPKNVVNAGIFKELGFQRVQKNNDIETLVLKEETVTKAEKIIELIDTPTDKIRF